MNGLKETYDFLSQQLEELWHVRLHQRLALEQVKLGYNKTNQLLANSEHGISAFVSRHDHLVMNILMYVTIINIVKIISTGEHGIGL